MTARAAVLLLAVLAAGMLLPSAARGAEARDIVKTDGNDTPGPLDLASVRLTQFPEGRDRFWVRTQSAFTAGQLDGVDGWIAVDFDLNADRRADYSVFVYYYRGKLYAIQARGSNFVRRLPVRRTDKRTVSFDITHKNLGHPTSYDFGAFSVWRAAPCSHTKVCVDGIPNRYPLPRHDFTAPTAKWRSIPNLSILNSDTSTFTIAFVAKDDRYGSGLRYWRLQSMTSEAPDWVTIKQGTKAANQIDIVGDRGTLMSFRIIALDRAGHRTVSNVRTVEVPFDDRDPDLTFSSPTQLSRVGAYEGTITQLANGETMTFTHTFTQGGSVCLIVGHPETGGSTATASWTLDTVPLTAPVTLNDATPDLQCTSTSVAAGSHTIVVTGTSAEPYVIDGLAVPG